MKEKISNRDKNSLLVIGVLIAILTCVFMFFNLTRYIPLKWIAIATMLFEVLYLMPAVCSKYYYVRTGKKPWYCYVPILNIIQLCLNKVTVCLLLIT